jgi:hypothetical protein
LAQVVLLQRLVLILYFQQLLRQVAVKVELLMAQVLLLAAAVEVAEVIMAVAHLAQQLKEKMVEERVTSRMQAVVEVEQVQMAQVVRARLLEETAKVLT